MILKCGCVHSDADILYGKGMRPHIKLATRIGVIDEYICHHCSYIRTRSEGIKSGKKTVRNEKT